MSTSKKIFNKILSAIKNFKLTKLDIAMAFGLVAAISLTGFSSFAHYCELKEKEVLRLHILANSNTDEDQKLKYAVRDELLQDFANDMKEARSVEQAKTIAKNNIKNYEDKAQDFVREKGYDYEVKAEVVNMYFTTRNYESYTLPAGNYDAIRIIIGSGEGKNWWCLVYPSLCLPAVSEEQYFSENEENVDDNQADVDSGSNESNQNNENNENEIILTEESSKRIEESQDIEFRFAIYEFLKNLFNK